VGGLIVSGGGDRYSERRAQRRGGIRMSVQMVLLPVFVQIGLTFALLLWMVRGRRGGLVSEETKLDQFGLPVLFYALIALAMPTRHTDLFIVAMSWVFVVTRFVHAGVFANSNDAGKRSTAWSAGVLVLFAMWVYFAVRILLPI
jgi:hypothetical protein